MWIIGQIATHVLWNNLKIIHWLSVKLAVHFIHTIIKLLVEKSMCYGPISLRSYRDIHAAPLFRIQKRAQNDLSEFDSIFQT